MVEYCSVHLLQEASCSITDAVELLLVERKRHLDIKKPYFTAAGRTIGGIVMSVVRLTYIQ